MTLKLRISEDMKASMKAKASDKLAAIRLLLAAIKQKEVDERIELDDAAVVVVIDKMLKQRRDSISQYEAAQRQDLADREQFEMDVLLTYLPKQLSIEEIDQLIVQAVADSGAASMQDMGKVMALLRPKLAGRADMAQVSAHIKLKLNA
ncbi:GatB/YqeY domain-containing protein [Neisseriaceae bacterium TC5R-5]|nr:GatB/YqeY domain-containing protein [Neisseriaceae bacterium TC5R-5]